MTDSLTHGSGAHGDVAGDPLRDALVAALGAQYDVLRLIGRGGMGAVYLGRERLLDRLVAIKVLPHESGTDVARERFLREARTAARLTHPNVVPLYSFGEAGRTLFYIMGYVDGESLEQRLRRERRLPFDEARRILAGLADALHHAHGQGVVHRDIKPDNILLEASTGRPVLTDFGIARSLAGQTLTGTGMVMGTPAYMSPEQAAGERELDGRSDVYSLGVVGYRMIAGRLPFEAPSFRELVAQQMTRDPAPLGTIVPEVPPELESAVMRCLTRDPAERWPSAAALRDALGGTEGEPDLPGILEKLPASISTTIALGVPLTWAGVIVALYTEDWFPALIAAFGAIGSVIEWRRFRAAAKKHGLNWERIKYMAFWPPRLLNMWWPRRFRRPDDVWDRLPQELQRARALMTAGWVGGLGLFLPLILAARPLGGGDIAGPALARLLMAIGLGGVMAASLGTVGVAIAMTFRLRRHGLNDRDVSKLLSERTWGSKFWKRPDISRLLQPARVPAPQLPESPAAVVGGLEQLARDVREPWRALVAEALAAAREVAAAVSDMDEEIRTLARDNDPAERERLRARLVGLDASATDAGATRQMRDLVAGQLGLMDQLARRAEDLTARRSRCLELLRTLWLQCSALRAQQAAGALDTGHTELLRALVRDVSRAVSAEGVVARLASDATTPV